MRTVRIFLFAAVAGSVFCAAEAAARTCQLTAEDKTANAKLSFDDFDQKGVTPSTARQLGDRECYLQAAEATEHYLVHGPVIKAGEQRVLLFHMAQYLAHAGHDREAARLFAATKNVGQPASELNWNSYVDGTWAFLMKDRARLLAARAQLEAGTSAGDKINAKVLAGFERCFDKSYAEAYGPPCRRQ